MLLLPFLFSACGDERPIIFLEPLDSEQFSGYGITFSEDENRKIEKIESLYKYNCSTCHKASVGIGPDLTDTKWTHGRTPMKIFNVIYFGVNEMSARERPKKGSMPAFGGKISARKIWDVAVWLSGEYKSKEE